MNLLGKDLIEALKKSHPTCAKALDRVVDLIKAAHWNNPNDTKQTLGVNVDFVGKQTVIDAGGNKARLITMITYKVKTVIVTHALDHIEYDKNKWKE
jgi:mRNA interferase HigB